MPDSPDLAALKRFTSTAWDSDTILDANKLHAHSAHDLGALKGAITAAFGSSPLA